MKTNTFQNPRGSVMLMVVVVLVLLAMIGTAYLQVARLDRVATAQLTTNNIDIVAVAVTSYISDVLKNDLLDDTQQFLFTAGEDEPYDYPWTNTSAPGYDVQDSSGGLLGTAQGGKNDDTWLASTEPDFGATAANTDDVWPHLTNLTGVLLRIRKDRAQPEEYVTDNSTIYLGRDTNVKIASATNSLSYVVGSPTNTWTLGADADGDGVLDSRWTWAPIRQISGISYVMAVRIVDNSAMLNANVALSQVSAANAYDADTIGMDAPRWAFPTTLDFGNFYFSTDAAPTDAKLQDFLEYRLGMATISTRIPWDIGPNTTDFNKTRFGFWLDAARRWGNFDAAFVSLNNNDELELRHRNGLNNLNIDTNIELNAQGMDAFLRQSDTELAYTDITGLKGVVGTPTVQEFFELEPRHQLTTTSGAATYAMALPDEPGTTPITHNGIVYSNANGNMTVFNDLGILFKEDINTLALQTTATNLSLEIRKVIERGTFTIPPHVNSVGGLTAEQKLEYFANQAAVSIQDAVDPDNHLRVYQGRYGLEALPVITEVYIQRAYKVSAAIPAGAGAPTLPTNGEWAATVTTSTSEKTGWAIEIRNPYQRPIRLKDVFLYIDGTRIGTSDLDSIFGLRLASDTWDRQLYPGQTLIVYKDSTTPHADGRNSIISLLPTFAVWTTSTSYSVGDKVWQSGKGYQCISAHTSSGTNQPGSVAGPLTWQLIRVEENYSTFDWPEDLNGTVSVELRAKNQQSGLELPWPYDKYTAVKWASADSRPFSSVLLPMPNGYWTIGTTYTAGQIVRSPNASYRAYKRLSINPGPETAAEEPEVGGFWANHWELAPEADTVYLQSSRIGSSRGINRLASLPNSADTDTAVFRSLRAETFRDYLPRLGKVDKRNVDWVTAISYSPGNIVFNSSVSGGDNKTYLCQIAHTSSVSNRPDVGTADWREIPPGGAQDKFDPTNSQIVLTDTVTAEQWNVNKPYAIGDAVSNSNGVVFTCIAANTGGTEPTAPTASWVLHWRDEQPVSHIIELSEMILAGPDSTRTIRDIVNQAASLDALRLDMVSSSTTYVGGGQLAIPHAIALMHRFTTTYPSTDGEDNDGDTDIDEPGESLVPGLINFNTAPTHLLEKILPIANATLRSDVVAAIKAYREGAGRLTNWRTAQGFAYTEEIHRALTAASSANLTSGPFAGDTDMIGTTVVDFNNPTQLVPDGIADDREEEMMLSKWLSQVGTTRSDIFTAYILLKGYPAGNFWLGAVESKRLLVVFDRSGIVTGTEPVKVLGIFEVN